MMNHNHQQKKAQRVQMDLRLDREEVQVQHQEEVQPLQVAQEQVEERLNEDVRALQMEDFEIVDVYLADAQPVFARQDANLYRQRDQEQIRQSKKKAARKQAAADQAQADYIGRTRMNAALEEARADAAEDPDALLRLSVLDEEIRQLQALGERVDVTGHRRRKNEKEYANRANSRAARKEARQDVDNLVKNLRMDIGLEGDPNPPEDMHEYTEAFYFTKLFGEAAIREKEEAKEELEKAGAPEAEVQRAKEQLGKIKDMALWQKSNGSNFAVVMGSKARDLQARRLARQQILDEGNTAYHQLMVALLDEEIARLQDEYDGMAEGLRTASGKVGTPKVDAQIAAQGRLAQLCREMKAEGTTEERKEAIMTEAREIYRNFNY